MMIKREDAANKLQKLMEEKGQLEAEVAEMQDNIKQLNSSILQKIDYINVYQGGIEAINQLLTEDNEENIDSVIGGQESEEIEDSPVILDAEVSAQQ